MNTEPIDIGYTETTYKFECIDGRWRVRRDDGVTVTLPDDGTDWEARWRAADATLLRMCDACALFDSHKGVTAWDDGAHKR